MSVAKRITDLRIDHDLTQEAVAGILNTARNYYGEYERGKRALPIEHLKTLCEYYNVSADYILGITDDPVPPKK